MKDRRMVWTGNTYGPGKHVLAIWPENFGGKIGIDAIRMEGRLDSYIVTDILVDGKSQVIRETVLPPGVLPKEAHVWTVVHAILGRPKKFDVPARAFETPLALKLDTAKEKVEFKLKNVGKEHAPINVCLIEREP